MTTTGRTLVVVVCATPTSAPTPTPAPTPSFHLVGYTVRMDDGPQDAVEAGSGRASYTALDLLPGSRHVFVVATVGADDEGTAASTTCSTVG